MAFHAALLEGLFFPWSEGRLSVRTDTGDILSVEDPLRRLAGEHVQVALHHLPSGGLDPNAWGWGSCQWRPAECPAGHHQKPGYLFTFAGSGVLRPDPWRLDLFAGGSAEIDFRQMPGHVGRLALATVLDVEKMRESLESLNPEALGIKADELKDLLGRLKTGRGHQ